MAYGLGPYGSLREDTSDPEPPVDALPAPVFVPLDRDDPDVHFYIDNTIGVVIDAMYGLREGEGGDLDQVSYWGSGNSAAEISATVPVEAGSPAFRRFPSSWRVIDNSDSFSSRLTWLFEDYEWFETYAEMCILDSKLYSDRSWVSSSGSLWRVTYNLHGRTFNMFNTTGCLYFSLLEKSLAVNTPPLMPRPVKMKMAGIGRRLARSSCFRNYERKNF